MQGPARLNRDDFSRALRDGRGDALLHALHFGIDGLEDLVQAACLNSVAYDAQCEGSRAPWLYRMFKDSECCGRIAMAVLDALLDEAGEYSRDQLCELAGLMARDGNVRAASTLRQFVLGQDFLNVSYPAGCESLVLLDGMPALIEIVRRFGQMLIADAKAGVSTLDALTEGTTLIEQARRDLLSLGSQDEAIAVYLKNDALKQAEQDRISSQTEEERQKGIRARALESFPLQTILEHAAAAKGSYPGYYTRFGRYAPRSDLETVLQRLASEEDPEVRLRLLWVFGRANPPRLDPCLWNLVEDDDVLVRDAALAAISGIGDPLVGEYGRTRLMASGDPAYIQVLAMNYVPGDEHAILAALDDWAFVDDDDLHFRSYGVQAVCDEVNSPAISSLLEWICKRNPCSICRNDAFELLVEFSPPPALVHECLHDAHADTVALARAFQFKTHSQTRTHKCE